MVEFKFNAVIIREGTGFMFIDDLITVEFEGTLKLTKVKASVTWHKNGKITGDFNAFKMLEFRNKRRRFEHLGHPVGSCAGSAGHNHFENPECFYDLIEDVFEGKIYHDDIKVKATFKDGTIIEGWPEFDFEVPEDAVM
jgi:hypothetical protein